MAAPSHEQSVLDIPVGDFDWGPRRRWRSAVAAWAPALLLVLGALLLIAAVTQL